MAEYLLRRRIRTLSETTTVEDAGGPVLTVASGKVLRVGGPDFRVLDAGGAEVLAAHGSDRLLTTEIYRLRRGDAVVARVRTPFLSLGRTYLVRFEEGPAWRVEGRLATANVVFERDHREFARVSAPDRRTGLAESEERRLLDLDEGEDLAIVATVAVLAVRHA